MIYVRPETYAFVPNCWSSIGPYCALRLDNGIIFYYFLN